MQMAETTNSQPPLATASAPPVLVQQGPARTSKTAAAKAAASLVKVNGEDAGRQKAA